jgi:hypothetical protein
MDKRILHATHETRMRWVEKIATELAKGERTLNQILYEHEPRIAKHTLYDWRAKHSEMNDLINEAFDVCGDNVVTRMRWTARGDTVKGDSSGDPVRDKLIIYVDEKRLAVLDARYASKLMLGNDPENPITETKPSRMTREQLLRIAQGAGEPENK